MPADRTKSWLDGLQVASPCLASWEEMRGDERERFCARCEKSVFNLSALTRAEAEEFLKQRTGTGACVLFYRRQDGTLITNNCPVGLERIRRRVRYLSASIAAACSFLFAWKADAPGLKWSHARDAASATGSPDQPPLDPKLLEELRHLGYVQ